MLIYAADGYGPVHTDLYDIKCLMLLFYEG